MSAEASAPEKAEGAAPAEAKKGKMKLFIIIGVVVVLLAGGGAGGWYFYKKKAEAAEAEKAKEGKEGEEGEAKGKKGEKKGEKAGEEEEHAEGGEEHAEEPEEEVAEEEEEPPRKKSAVDRALTSLPNDKTVKHVIELQPYVVNLADAEGSRYLRVTINVGVGGEEGEEKEEKEEKTDPLFTARVRNAMLAVLTTKSSEEVLTVEGKAKLRKELLRAARKASEEPKVVAIYITEFIVQL